MIDENRRKSFLYKLLKKNKNSYFEKLVLDEEFVKNLNSDSNKSDEYLNGLLRSQPDKKEIILLAAKFIQLNKNEVKKLDALDKEQLWRSVLAKSFLKRNGIEIKHKSIPIIWKVAALIIVLFSTTYLIINESRENHLKKYITENFPTGDKALIVFPKGIEYEIRENDSQIDYSNNAEVIIKNTEVKESSENVLKKIPVKERGIHQVIVPIGTRHQVILSDGTKVTLNSGSKLVFPNKFSGSIRKVYLTGEGFFDAIEDNSTPFIVETEHINVKVLGTQFNVSAYSDETTFSTVLVKGKVVVSEKLKSFDNHKFELTPGQGHFYTLEGGISEIKDVDILDYIGWKEGWLQFKNQSAEYIIRKVEKYYNRSISVEGHELSSTLISGKLVLSNSIEDVLGYLVLALDARYKLNADSTYLIFNKESELINSK